MLGKEKMRDGLWCYKSTQMMLGEGAFGAVYKGIISLPPGKPREECAVKIFRVNTKDPDYERKLKYFQQEAEVTKLLDHPNVIKTFDSGVKGNEHYIAMEYCANGSLLKHLRQLGKTKLSEEECKPFLVDILNGLEYLHSKSLYHRDLKLDNILLTGQNVIKIADFGLAKQREASSKLFCSINLPGMNDGPLNTLVGTPGFMAPEIFEGRFSETSDVFAFGCMAYLLVSGTDVIPFSGVPIKEVMAKFKVADVKFPPTTFSPMFKDFLIRCLDEESKHRLSVKELLNHPWLQKTEKENFRISGMFLDNFAKDQPNYLESRLEDSIVKTIESDISSQIMKKSANLYQVFTELEYNFLNSDNYPYKGDLEKTWLEIRKKLKGCLCLMLVAMSKYKVGDSPLDLFQFSDWYLSPFYKCMQDPKELEKLQDILSEFSDISVKDLIIMLRRDSADLIYRSTTTYEKENGIYFQGLFDLFVNTSGEMDFKLLFDKQALASLTNKLGDGALDRLVQKVTDRMQSLKISEANILTSDARISLPSSVIDAEFKPFVPFVAVDGN